MREIGEVKWFGGYNEKNERPNNFGFITPLSWTQIQEARQHRAGKRLSDIYVNREGLTSATRDLEKGVLVTYERRSEGVKERAINVVLLHEEQDPATLELALKYEKAAAIAFERLHRLGLDKRLSRQSVISALKSLSEGTLFWEILVSRLQLFNKNQVEDLFEYGVERFSLLPKDLGNVPRAILESGVLLTKLATIELIRVSKWLLSIYEDELVLQCLSIWLGREVRDDFHPPTSRLESTDNEIIGLLAMILQRTGTEVAISKILVDEAERRNLYIRQRDKELFDSVDLLQSVARPILHPELFLDLAWATGQAKQIWDGLVAQIKLAFILRSIVFEEPFTENHPALREMLLENQDLLIRAGSLFYRFAFSQIHETEAVRAYDLLEEWVCDQVNGTNVVTLSPALPECSYFLPVVHCEARHWPTAWRNVDKQEKSLSVNSRLVAYCPRIGGEAYLAGRRKWDHDESGCFSAHLYPLEGRSTLVEALSKLSHLPLPERIKEAKNSSYASWLSGAINRVNEIRKRLACRKCEGTLRFDPDYARNLARYRATVAKCSVCQIDVYFNHCWNCGGIIDSRDSRFKTRTDSNGKSFHYCIKCSAGSKSNKDIGNTCPNCNLKGTLFHLKIDENGYETDVDLRTCNNCNHSIDLKASRGLRLEVADIVRNYQPGYDKDLSYVPSCDNVS